MGLHSWDIPQLVQTILTGLVVFPAIALFALVFSKPGAKHDYTRKWVDFTKAALGLWSASYLLNFIGSTILLVVYSRERWGRPIETDIVGYVYVIASLLHAGAQIAFYLALFYLVHALTQLRVGTEADETRQFRIGQKVALGVSGLVALIYVTIFSLGIAISAMISSMRDGRYIHYDAIMRMSYAREYLYYCYLGILIIAAIAITVCAIAARRKARDTPLAKAATLLLVSVSIGLGILLWDVIYILIARFDPFSNAYRYLVVIDIFFRVWPSFAALSLLCILASRDSYGLSRIHYQVNDDEEQDA